MAWLMNVVPKNYYINCRLHTVHEQFKFVSNNDLLVIGIQYSN